MRGMRMGMAVCHACGCAGDAAVEMDGVGRGRTGRPRRSWWSWGRRTRRKGMRTMWIVHTHVAVAMMSNRHGCWMLAPFVSGGMEEEGLYGEKRRE